MASWNEGGASPNQLRAFQGAGHPLLSRPLFLLFAPTSEQVW